MAATAYLSKRQTEKWTLPQWLLVAGVVSGLAICVLPLKVSCAVLALLCFIAGVLYDPIVAFAAALFSGPLGAWSMLQSSGIPPYIGQYAFLIFLAGVFVNALMRRQVYLVFPPLLLPLILFLFAALLSLWNPVDSWQGFTEFIKWAQIAIVFVIVYQRLEQKNTNTETVLMVVLLGTAGLVQAAIGLWQFALRHDGPETFAISSRFYRAYGTFQQPNPFAGFVAMMAAILLGILLVFLSDACRTWKRGENKASLARWIVLLCGATGILTAALIASWSRGGWIGFGAAVLVMLFLTPITWRRGFLVIAVLILFSWFLYSTGLLPQNITDRLGGITALFQFSDIRSVGITDVNFSLIERIAHWQTALNMWRSRFWFGIGLGGYESAYPLFRLPNWTLPLGHAHNIYLNMLAETGILGLSAYGLLMGTILVKLGHAAHVLDGWLRGLAVGLTGAWVHLMVHNLVDNLFVNNVHLHVGLMLALSAWVITKAQRKKTSDAVVERL